MQTSRQAATQATYLAIDTEPPDRTVEVGGARTNKAAVKMASAELITRREPQRAGELTGKLEWNESLDGRNETQPRTQLDR